VLVYSGWWGCKLFNRLSSLLAIRSASSGSFALAKRSANLATSSSASSSLSSTSPPLVSLPSPEVLLSELRWALFCNRCKSFCTSWICRCNTTCLNSSSRDFWMLELISLLMRLASVSLCTKSKAISKRSLIVGASRSFCRSSTVNCAKVAPTRPTNAFEEEGQRNWRRDDPEPLLFSC